MPDTLHIGSLITTPQSRDAVHMAIVPQRAISTLHPGQHVGVLPTGAMPVGLLGLTAVGIVDPFLTQDVPPGADFWLFLYPGSITSLRHDWTHPAFIGEVSASPTFHNDHANRRWLANYCSNQGADLENILDGHSGDCEGFEISEEFSQRYRAYTGEPCPEYFSCSC